MIVFIADFDHFGIVCQCWEIVWRNWHFLFFLQRSDWSFYMVHVLLFGRKKSEFWNNEKNKNLGDVRFVKKKYVFFPFFFVNTRCSTCSFFFLVLTLKVTAVYSNWNGNLQSFCNFSTSSIIKIKHKLLWKIRDYEGRMQMLILLSLRWFESKMRDVKVIFTVQHIGGLLMKNSNRFAAWILIQILLLFIINND